MTHNNHNHHARMEPYDRTKEHQQLDAMLKQMEIEGAIHHAWQQQEYAGMQKPVEIQYADGTTGWCTSHTYFKRE